MYKYDILNANFRLKISYLIYYLRGFFVKAPNSNRSKKAENDRFQFGGKNFWDLSGKSVA